MAKLNNPNSPYWKKKASLKWGEHLHYFKRKCLVDDFDCMGNLEGHHLITKANVLTRNDPDNGVMLCTNHHRGSTSCSPHAGPEGFNKFLEDNYPDKAAYILKNKFKTGKPNFKEDYIHLTELMEE